MSNVMKCLMVAVTVTALFLLGSPALAFHDGGVAYCAGCHTMHASPGNPADTPGGNQFLLKESNSTDTCTRCHNTSRGNTWGSGVLTPGNVYGGGQFVFLLEDNLNDGRSGHEPARWIPGHQAGHNVISIDKGTVADPVNTSGPGGSYLSGNLHCTSCHDPHGQGGHFRLLYGAPYDSFAMGYAFPYTTPAPEAEGISISGAAESSAGHTAFKGGMSEWCGNCHGDFHNTSYPTTLKHPSGATLGAEIAANYNMYNGSGSYDGVAESAYLALVPFEDAAATTTSTQGPTGTSKVVCVSCHRAHASSAPNSGRWDFNVTEWVEEGVESGAYAIPNPYAATSGSAQRSLCNKCHAKDPVL
jgi:hypothetical protein